jgi:DNA-binding MarR family transcriptional regulator
MDGATPQPAPTSAPLAPVRPGGRSRRFDSAEQEAYLTLWRTYDRLRAHEDELFARFELTAQQYNLLRLLRSSHPRPVPTQVLASRMISRAPDVSRMIDRLESMGLIVRERSASDRRSVLVALAPQGERLLERIAGPLQACHRAQLGHLGRSQLRLLTELLNEARQPHEPPDSPWSRPTRP